MKLSRVIAAAGIALTCTYVPMAAGGRRRRRRARHRGRRRGRRLRHSPRRSLPQAAPPTQASIDRANQILAEARTAMGGRSSPT